MKQQEYLPRSDCTKWCDSTISIILRDSIFSIGWFCETFYVQPSVINMFAYYRHCAWQLQWLNWWVFHNDVNAPLVLLHKSDNIKVYHPDLHSLKYCVSTVRTHHFLYWLWMAVDEHLVRSRKRGSFRGMLGCPHKRQSDRVDSRKPFQQVMMDNCSDLQGIWLNLPCICLHWFV